MSYCGEDFSDADPLDDEWYCLNFAARLPPGVTVIAAAYPCRLTVAETFPGFAPDLTPSARLNGPAAPGTPLDGSTTAQTCLIQRITNPMAGNVYVLDGWADCSDG